MNDKFDELAKGLAQSVTRRWALKKFGGGLAAIALASLGLAKKAQAHPKRPHFTCHCNRIYAGCDPGDPLFRDCVFYCSNRCGSG